MTRYQVQRPDGVIVIIRADTADLAEREAARIAALLGEGARYGRIPPHRRRLKWDEMLFVGRPE